MKVWHGIMLVVLAIVIFAYIHDPRKAAFTKVDKAIAQQLKKESNHFLDEAEKSGNLDVIEFRRIVMKYAAQSNMLRERYEAGLMPDGTAPTK